MATIVLTAAGALVAGPFGAAIGAVVGQQIDSKLFAPKARQGPRLGDLAVQTSSYGTAIPKVFGTMRVAGTVIWATEIKERKRRSGGGKGRPQTVTYSYSASFAVALSGRKIRSVRRIWADGKLLRGAAGDFKSETGFRLHHGTEDQPVDPLMAAAKGAGKVPAHRGLAYAVFKDFQLADYGNRIPSLTFEVEADAGPVPIGSIAEELSGGEVRGGPTPALAGYAAGGDSLRAAIEGLSGVAGLSLLEGEGEIVLSPASGSEERVPERAIGARGAGREGGLTETSRRSSSSVPTEVSITYHDQARDYQTGLQRAKRGTAGGSERLALPAVLTASIAKSLAESRLAQLWAAREAAKVHLPFREGRFRPGSIVAIEGQHGRWKVARWTLAEMVVSLDLERVAVRTTEAGASPGESLPQTDRPLGPTTLFLFDLPSLGDTLATRPHLIAFAGSTGGGWRRAALLASYDGGVSWDSAGSTAAAAVMGRALAAVPPAGSALIDERNSIEVQLLNDDMWLEARTDQALGSGANLAAVGDELIQFGGAEPLGGGRFRLSRLLRGRRGTEWAAENHVADEPFVLMEAESAAVIEPPVGIEGSEIRMIAEGLGDGENPPEVTLRLEGRSVQPPAPVHLRAERNLAGDLHIIWVRRSRIGWAWSGGGDAPVGEEAERYRLTIAGAGGRREAMLDEPRFTYAAAQQDADGNVGSLQILVVQVGTHAASPAATLLVN